MFRNSMATHPVEKRFRPLVTWKALSMSGVVSGVVHRVGIQKARAKDDDEAQCHHTQQLYRVRERQRAQEASSGLGY